MEIFSLTDVPLYAQTHAGDFHQIMASSSTYSLASEDTKEARRGKHQQEISDNLTGHIKNFWAAPAEGLPTMPVSSETYS